MPKTRGSSVWTHFILDEATRKAVCTVCGNQFSIGSSGTTSGLWNHLRDRHGNLYEQIKKLPADSVTPRRVKPEPDSDGYVPSPKKRKELPVADISEEATQIGSEALDQLPGNLAAEAQVSSSIRESNFFNVFLWRRSISSL
uniref:BED-type domain-containing protein n=1 Tax=Steinernema glaseri TaxID=37863 RepID=A0A1I7Y8L9_9BILA